MGTGTQLMKHNAVQLTARLDKNNMMMIEGTIQEAVTPSRCLVLTSAELWHNRMAHAADSVLAKMPDTTGKRLIDNSATHISKDCDICLKAKQHRVSFATNEDRASRTLELVHADVMDFEDDIRSYGGGRYVLVIIGDYSRFSDIRIMDTKGQAAVYSIEILREWQTQTGNKL